MWPSAAADAAAAKTRQFCRAAPLARELVIGVLVIIIVITSDDTNGSLP